MIRIYGHSDDCIEIEGSVKDEIGAWDKPRAITITDRIGQGVRVLAQYAPGDAAVWRFSVEQLDEDVPVPWPIRITPAHGYSVAVEIDCGDDVTVEHDKPKAQP